MLANLTMLDEPTNANESNLRTKEINDVELFYEIFDTNKSKLRKPSANVVPSNIKILT